MSSRTNHVQFDPTQYYILSEAFFRVGLALFPDQWRGTEQFAMPVEGFEKTKLHKEALEETRSRLQRQRIAFGSIDLNGLPSEEFEAKIRQEKLLETKALKVRDELFQVGQTYDSEYQDNETWLRRVVVEERLCRAFSEDELTLFYGGNSILNWNTSHRELPFRISFGFSILYVPSFTSGRRKYTAHIRKKDFDLWYAVQPDFSNDGVQKTEEEMVKSFILALVQSSETNITRKDLVTRLRTEFPSLSERAALNYRSQYVPEEWKHAGRKRKG